MEKTRSLQSLMQAGRAFQESRVLLTAIELDVFGALGEGASVAELSSQLGTDARATEMLLNALVAGATNGILTSAPITLGPRESAAAFRIRV